MIIKADFDELKDVENVIINNKDSLNYELEKLLQSLERLKEIWFGEDFDTFYNNAYPYISRMKVLCTFMETIGNVIKNSGDFYKEQDDSYADSLKKERAAIDEQIRN